MALMMVKYTKHYWICGLCPLSSILKLTWCFRNWICFCPQVKRCLLSWVCQKELIPIIGQVRVSSSFFLEH